MYVLGNTHKLIVQGMCRGLDVVMLRGPDLKITRFVPL